MNDDDLDEIEMAHRARTRAAAEVERLTTAPRLAEASVSLLRADLGARDLELRRLRAAQSPGTDDEAVAPWTWCEPRGDWQHGDWTIERDHHEWVLCRWGIEKQVVGRYALAVDAMVAVEGEGD